MAKVRPTTELLPRSREVEVGEKMSGQLMLKSNRSLLKKIAFFEERSSRESFSRAFSVGL